MDLSIISGLLRAIGGVAANPAFGSGQAIGIVAQLGASLIDAGEDGEEGLKELTTQVESMVAAGRNPTPDEFNSLRARSDAAHAAIQNAGVKDQEAASAKKTIGKAAVKTDEKKGTVSAQSTSQHQSASVSSAGKPAIAPSAAKPVIQQTGTPVTAIDKVGQAVNKDSGSVIPPKADATQK